VGQRTRFVHLYRMYENAKPGLQMKKCVFFQNEMAAILQFTNSPVRQLYSTPDSSRSDWPQLPIGPGSSRSILVKTGVSSSKRELPGPIGTYRELSGPKSQIPRHSSLRTHKKTVHYTRKVPNRFVIIFIAKSSWCDKSWKIHQAMGDDCMARSLVACRKSTQHQLL
jgi:hypothetical protein